LHRRRHDSEPGAPGTSRHGSPGPPYPGTPASGVSKNNSLSLPRDPEVPPRDEDETPAKYLVRLEEAIGRGIVAAMLSKTDDTFAQSTLRSHMRSFAFFEDPMDMAIRKVLMEVMLPKETQQIDRVLQAFADRYHECNPGIFPSAGKFVEMIVQASG
jgi:Sec7-like guanine-nucleotide exchange factor